MLFYHSFTVIQRLYHACCFSYLEVFFVHQSSVLIELSRVRCWCFPQLTRLSYAEIISRTLLLFVASNFHQSTVQIELSRACYCSFLLFTRLSYPEIISRTLLLFVENILCSPVCCSDWVIPIALLLFVSRFCFHPSNVQIDLNYYHSLSLLVII